MTTTSKPSTRNNPTTPAVVLDCDTGIDDALALMYLAGLVAAGEVQLRAVTTTAGNVDATQTAYNSAYILRLCGLSTVPVVPGCPTPLRVPLTTTPETHGPHGLGYVIPPLISTPTVAVTPGVVPAGDVVGVGALDAGDVRAGDFAVEPTQPAPWQTLWQEHLCDDTTLIVTGPATNLATYIHNHPWPPHVCLMGGAYLYPGNTTPTAEWNTWVDPHAAATVFRSDNSITVCSLEVTEQLLLTPVRLTHLQNLLGMHPLSAILPDMLRFYFEFHDAMGEGYQAQIHDLLTTMVALNTITYRSTHVAVDVETESPLLRGTTVADTKNHWGRNANVKLVTNIDPEQAWAEFFRAIKFLVL